MAWERIELHDEKHPIESFNCGLTSVDEWVRNSSLTQNNAGRIRTHICLDTWGTVVAFYALKHVIVDVTGGSKSTLRLADGPGGQATGMLLAQMGVNSSHQSKGVGKAVVNAAIHSAVEANQQAAFRLFVVDAENDSLVPYYEKFQFKRLGDSRRLIMKMSTANKIVEALN